jgi:hypothetical protein
LKTLGSIITVDAMREPDRHGVCSTHVKAGLLMTVGAVLALGIASPTDTSARRAETARRPATVLALRYDRESSAQLVRLDRRTLAPARGRRVRIGDEPGAWAFSPDGSRLAIGSGEALGLRIVDLRGMRSLGDVQTRNGSVSIVAWLTPRRIVGVEETGLFVVDPVGKRMLRSDPLDGFPYGAARFGGSLVLLLSSGELGPARLALVDADGDVRSVVLDQILAGFRNPSGEPRGPFGESWRPGLAIDAVGGRAFVVGGGAPVAEVDLRTLAVRYHDPARPVSLLGRLRAWLEPEARAKGPVAGSWRTARWLGDDRLAFTGEDGRAVGGGRVDVTAVGLNLVDTSSWKSERLDSRANGMAFAAGTLVGTRQGLEVGRGIGLVAFDRDGGRRFHLLGDARLSIMDTLDDRVFFDDETRTRAADLRRGRLVNAPRTVPTLLVGSMSRY